MVRRLALAPAFAPAFLVLLGVACSSPGAASTTDEAFAVSAVTTPGSAALLLNEVLANEPGSATSGEMIEVVNTTAASIDLTGYTLSDGVAVRHTFAGTVLAPGRAIAVFGGAAGIPAGLTNAVAASTGALSLGNAGDTVTLRDATSSVMDTVTYDATLGGADGVSFNRDVDGSPAAKAWVLHTTLSSLSASPAKRTDGTDFTVVVADGGTPDAAPDSAPPPPPPPPDAGPPGALRIVAGNLSSGNAQSYDPGEGIRIFQALKPDVALVQEMNYGANDDASIRTFVDTAFGPSYAYVREPFMQIPNGVVSRYPIVQSGVWDDPQVTNRDFTWARIDIPGTRDLWAVSVHLLTSSATSRVLEAQALVGYVQSTVPAGDYVAIGGDFNAGDAALLGVLGAVVDANAAYPDDQSGNFGTNTSRAKHYDWVLVSAGLEAFQRPTRVGSVERPNGLVFDTRVFSPIQDAFPALGFDSAAASMQHMAVVKDFFVQ